MKTAFENPFWGTITLDMQYTDYVYFCEQDGIDPLPYDEWLVEDEAE